MSKARVLFGVGVLASAVAGCGSKDDAVAKGKPDSGSAAPGAGGATGAGGTGSSAEAGSVTAAVRSSCGDLPILDDRWRDTSDECKSCFDTTCCAEAQACVDNPKCKELWECRSRCPSQYGKCLLDCNKAAGSPLPIQNGPVVSCRNNCAPCIDLTSCTKGPWADPPKPSYPTKFHFSNITSGVPFPQAQVKVCKMEDTECQAPVSEGVTDDNGDVDIEIPGAPAGYIDVSGPNVQPTLIYTRSYHRTEQLEAGFLNLGALDTATAGAFLGSIGSTGDPAKVGAVTALAYSCGDRGVKGLTGESSGAAASTIRSYLVRGTPSAAATATDSGGGVSFVDHPLGTTTVTMTDASGAVFGTGEGFVRPGTLTAIYVLPAH